jgi:hypothetical protein
MKQNHAIPFYGPDGTPLGYRALETAERLVTNGYAKPVYGRKRHLKAIFLPSEDGSSPVEEHPRIGTRYSFLQKLDSGSRCWKLRRVDGRDDDGVPVSTRGVFLQVIADCGGA